MRKDSQALNRWHAGLRANGFFVRVFSRSDTPFRHGRMHSSIRIFRQSLRLDEYIEPCRTGVSDLANEEDRAHHQRRRGVGIVADDAVYRLADQTDGEVFATEDDRQPAVDFSAAELGNVELAEASAAETKSTATTEKPCCAR